MSWAAQNHQAWKLKEAAREAEEWRPVVSCDGRFTATHEVSNLGRVRRTQATERSPIGAQVAPGQDDKGYEQVFLYADKRGITVKVHRLVAEAFLGQRGPGQQVNHKDGNKQNNNVANLEYVSGLENQRHAAHTFRDNVITAWGSRMSIAEAVERFAAPGVHYWMVMRRIKRHGWSAADALLTPPLGTGISRKDAGESH